VNPITGLVSTSASGYEPLTGVERWKLYFKMNYWSVGAYFGPFFSALVLDQASGSPAQWGGGFAGYGRRVASRVGSAILQGAFQAPVAYVLHEDVRYISSGHGGLKHRAWHAAVYSFLTYNNQGHPTLNIANLGGIYASTLASNLWLPSHNNLVNYTLSNGSEQIVLSIRHQHCAGILARDQPCLSSALAEQEHSPHRVKMPDVAGISEGAQP
jgi:hypothetical protein